MSRWYTGFIAVPILIACSQDGAANPQQVKSESCSDIQNERTAFRQQVKRKAAKLKADLGNDARTPDTETYPKLEDAQKLMEFQTEVEAGENKFAVRLRECLKG